MILFNSLVIYFLIECLSFAICPICTITMGAGLGVSRYLGISDLITGIWFGAFLTSSSIWLGNWLAEKLKITKKKCIGILIGISAILHIGSIIYVYKSGLIDYKFYTFLGIDKLLFGLIVGSITFLKANWHYQLIKKWNKNKPLFIYQKVIMSFLYLIITSIIFHFIIQYV